MSSEDILRENENLAISNNQIIAHVNGKIQKAKTGGRTLKSLGAIGFIVAMIGVFAIFFSSGNLIPSIISDRLIEEMDVQYADAVESKKLVFQQAMYNGKIPQNTEEILKDHGVLVEYLEDGSLVLRMGDKIITADNFINEVNNDINLYNAFNLATYSRAAYYYDEAAQKVFQKIGTNRDNYTSQSDFDEVMKKKVGSGSNIDINNVSLVEKKQPNSTETYIDYGLVGETVKTSGSADKLIQNISNKNFANSSVEATLSSADSLKVADTISKEQRSSLFFVTFMENISKMKAGEGSESKINEAMNYLHKNAESEVVDVKTGEILTIYGTPLDSPSLYAMLSGSQVNTEAIKNYSSDRILQTIENQVNQTGASSISNTVASSGKKTTGSIGRFIESGLEQATAEILAIVTPTVNSSLINNSYETIQGVNAGEFLVEGAINTGKSLAKASGATGGDQDAVLSYTRLNNQILAMDARAERINKSPFDITSKNTFLGVIFYQIAILSQKQTSGILVSGLKNFTQLTKNNIRKISPTSYADNHHSYLTNFGDCETYKTIGMVGSAQCSEIAVFDSSTLNDPFNNAEFIAFVEANTSLSPSGKRTIKQDSLLGKFILYNNERMTPLGVIDGGILSSLQNNSNSVSFLNDIVDMVKIFLGASETEKQIASGAAFVNSVNNPDWQTYKYAQRYISLARATEALRQYSNNSTAYQNILYFEGDENPVIAFLQQNYHLANKD